MKCLRGASAMNDVIAKLDPTGSRTRVFTVWEKVMKSDGEPPIPATLARVSQGLQFWDPTRAVSKQSYGETDEDSIAWDCLFIYPPGTRWENTPAPAHNFTARPVVDRKDEFEKALIQALH
jgi:hypothetical protein